MDATDQLANLRSAFPSCKVAVFADLSTGMILCSSTQTLVPQETLDMVCEIAIDLLVGDTTALISQTLDNEKVSQAITMNATDIGIYLRATQVPADSLCCLCDPHIDFDQFIIAARSSLEKISGQH